MEKFWEIYNSTTPYKLFSSFMSIEFVKYMLRDLYKELMHYAFPKQNPCVKLYGAALDAELISLDGKVLSLLADYIDKHTNPNLPLIINFGSCT
jgi:hypothetical protein